MERNNITVAIYGLGYIMETKFIAALDSKSITFAMKPNEKGEDNQKKRFNILLLHQNRPSRNSQQLQVPHMLHEICSFMDLIVWGHEQQNRAEIEVCCEMKITQSGSTIVTQLRKYEATLREMEVFFITKRLRTYRPFIISKFELDNTMIGKSDDEIMAIIRKKLNDMIDQRDDRDKVPLIRLNLVTSIDMRNVPYKHLTYEFSHQVTNPHNFIKISRKSAKSSAGKRGLHSLSERQTEVNGELEGGTVDFTTSSNYFENLLEKKFRRFAARLFNSRHTESEP